MSRLVFIENNDDLEQAEYDASDDYYVKQHEGNNDDDQGTKTIDKTNMKKIKKKKRKKSGLVFDDEDAVIDAYESSLFDPENENDTPAVEISPGEDENVRAREKKAKTERKKAKKRARVELEALEAVVVDEDIIQEVNGEAEVAVMDGVETKAVSTVKISSWLRTFLAQPREQEIIPPPELELSNDSYLREFAHEFENIEDVMEDDEDDDYNVSDINMYKPIHDTKGVDCNSITNVDEEDEEEEPTKSKSVAINIFNLPYSVGPSDINNLMEKLMLKVSEIAIKMDKKKGLPAGAVSCIVELSNGVTADQVVSTLKEIELGGRKIRVELINGSSSRNSRVSSVGGRYFGVDISCKCFLCGEVGHKSSDCINPPQSTPCGLCAGLDHDSQCCPNITCFRCGTFGHHSKTCSGVRMSKAAVCTMCGSTSHDSRACKYDKSTKCRLSKFEGENVVCMGCGEEGHVSCRRKPPASDGILYCSNCGEAGHHVDMTDKTGCTECVIPKNEAYIKFSSLLNYDNYAYRMADNNRHYRSLIRSLNYRFDDMTTLFPSLAASDEDDFNVPSRGSYRNIASGRQHNNEIDSYPRTTSSRHSYGGGSQQLSRVDGYNHGSRNSGSYGRDSESEREQSRAIPNTSRTVSMQQPLESSRSSHVGGREYRRYNNSENNSSRRYSV